MTHGPSANCECCQAALNVLRDEVKALRVALEFEHIRLAIMQIRMITGYGTHKIGAEVAEFEAMSRRGLY